MAHTNSLGLKFTLLQMLRIWGSVYYKVTRKANLHEHVFDNHTIIHTRWCLFVCRIWVVTAIHLLKGSANLHLYFILYLKYTFCFILSIQQ